MTQLDILKMQAELWQVRRNVCDLNLEIIRRDMIALEAAASATATPTADPAAAPVAEPVAGPVPG